VGKERLTGKEEQPPITCLDQGEETDNDRFKKLIRRLCICLDLRGSEVPSQRVIIQYITLKAAEKFYLVNGS
jgi:hypothetical protein